MKTTGIVRRIDDLGRVVIPKEIRRTLRLREGDPLELFMDGTDGVLFKKYSPIKALSDFIEGYTQAINEAIGHIVCIADSDNIVSVSGTTKKELLDKTISYFVLDSINKKYTLVRNAVNHDDMIDITKEEGNPYGYCSCIVTPIVVVGDAVGAIIILTKDEKIELGEFEIKFAKATAKLIEKQMGS
jgi:looped-hinge helix DNA binding domain, AbrB family